MGSIQKKPEGVGIQASAMMSACFLSGAMLSISFITVPVLYNTTDASNQLLRQWSHLYWYGHIYMPAMSVAVTGLFFYIAAQKRASKNDIWLRYAMAGATTITMVPYTLTIMAPTNNSLFALSDEALVGPSSVSLKEVQEIIFGWAWLHVARCVFPFVGSMIGLMSFMQESMGH
ncbi:hypothetical protein KCU77_g435, partial [Aureobasidium melanogenum]